MKNKRCPLCQPKNGKGKYFKEFIPKKIYGGAYLGMGMNKCYELEGNHLKVYVGAWCETKESIAYDEEWEAKSLAMSFTISRCPLCHRNVFPISSAKKKA